jgi:proline dehydrogenase
MQRNFISRSSSTLFNTSFIPSSPRSILQFNNASRPNTLTFLNKSRFHSHADIPPAPKKRLSIKAYSTAAAVSMAASFYYYNGKENNQKKVEISSAPISAFSYSTPSDTITQLLDDENRADMQAKSTEELLLGLFVYKLCTFSWIVDIAPHVLKITEALQLQKPVYWFVKNSFFSQFCGGETAEECVATMSRLSQSGINCILDLSIESDLHSDDAKKPSQGDQGKYFHHDQTANAILEMIKNCIKTAAQGQHEEYATSGAFAAVKVTAFAPPEFLLRLNQVLFYLEKTFEAYQVNGRVDSTCVKHVVSQICPPAQSQLQQEHRSHILSYLENNKGTLDYTEYTKLFNLRGNSRDIWWETDSSKTEKEVFLTQDDLQAYDKMVHRMEQVCQLAYDLRVGVMVDAEQSYFQEAIDHVAMNLQEKYNCREDINHSPTVYNTCKFCK